MTRPSRRGIASAEDEKVSFVTCQGANRYLSLDATHARSHEHEAGAGMAPTR